MIIFIWLFCENSGSNSLTGFIPSEFGQVENLTEIQLGGNQLTGVIPTELGQIDTLNTINLGENILISATFMKSISA